MINYDMAGLLGAVDEVSTRTDSRLDRMKAEAARLGTPVSCTGCRSAGCCYQPVATFIAEALVIAKHHPVPLDRREELIKDGLVQENSSKDWYFQQAIPCPFLAEDKSCSIYEQRPGACRRYLVVSPPTMCMPGQTRKVLALNTMDLDNEWVLTMVRFQTHYLGAPLEPIMMGSLPRMVAIASTALELPDGRSVRRFLRDQSWLTFDQPMAKFDQETVDEYRRAQRER